MRFGWLSEPIRYVDVLHVKLLVDCRGADICEGFDLTSNSTHLELRNGVVGHAFAIQGFTQYEEPY